MLWSLLVPLPGWSPYAASVPPVDRPDRPRLRVATYNIHAGSDAHAVFDLARLVKAIRALDADVVGLQEVDVRWGDRSRRRDVAAELASALGMRVFFAPIYDLEPDAPGGPPRRYGVAILSRFPILSTANHEITRLSTQTADPVPAPAPGFAEVVLDVRGVPVRVYTTHLDFRPAPEVRKAQVADMLRVLTCGGPAHRVLLGDFNAPHGAAELAPLWDVLSDVWPAAGDGAGPTYPAGDPAERIDYVAVSPSIGVTAARVEATAASDHLPVVADLVLDPLPPC